MTDELSKRLVLDELWELVQSLLPEFAPRRQGGGSASVDERAVFDRGHVRAYQWLRVADTAAVIRSYGATAQGIHFGAPRTIHALDESATPLEKAFTVYTDINSQCWEVPR